jgi:hypothetical protein
MMKRYRSLISVLILACMPACSNPEERARTIYNRGLEAKRAGKFLDQETALREIIKKYPSTTTATAANLELDQIENVHKAMRGAVSDCINILFFLQEDYRKLRGHYASSVDDLIAAKLLDETIVRPTLTNTDEVFTYQITKTADSYFIIVTPNNPYQYHFYAKPGVGIRADKGKPASATSPEFTTIAR